MDKASKIRIALTVVAILLMAGGYVVTRVSGGGMTTERVAEWTEWLKKNAKGTVKCDIGKRYSTRWFDFTVESVEKVQQYAGYKAGEGNILIDAVILEKCTFDSVTPMSASDFYLDSDDWEDYAAALEAEDDTMMPEEFDLMPGESVKYHVVYEIPNDASGVSLLYTEIDEEDAEHRTFALSIE